MLLKWITALSLLAAALPVHAKPHSAPIEKAAEYIPDSQCFFKPPQGWEISDPRTLSPHVKIAFLKNTGTGFRPSVNLAVEETSVSLNEYLKAVKAIHQQDRTNQWRALGKVRTAAGLAQLTEIDAKTEWGPIRILQLILLKEGSAYIMTASALREDFSNHYKEIQSAFRSLTLSSDLFGNIPQTERREALKSKQNQLIEAAEQAPNPLQDPLFQQKHWIPFQQTVLDAYNDMGAFWQVLILKGVQEKLLSLALQPQEIAQ